MTTLRASVRPHGFTLIEMLVTVTIVALLSTVAFPMLELAERRLELKRKTEDWQQSLIERQMALPLTIQRQKLELAEYWLKCMQAIDPDWRDDKRLCMQAKDRLY